MVCNAWNHSVNCNCGWGGDTNSAPTEQTYIRQVEQTQFSSFTIPNASCPICGDNVFFYQNSHGSKVWFDELGPPWEMHSCFKKERLERQTRQSTYPEIVPCVINKHFKKSGLSYVQATISDKYKKQKKIFLIFKQLNISKNSVCFFNQLANGFSNLHYYNIETMQSGSAKPTLVKDRITFLFLLKYGEPNINNTRKIKDYITRVRSLRQHQKEALALWLYDQTILDQESLQIFSGLSGIEIDALCRGKLKPTHTPQSPLSLNILNSASFSLLKKLSPVCARYFER